MAAQAQTVCKTVLDASNKDDFCGGDRPNGESAAGDCDAIAPKVELTAAIIED